MFGMLDYRAHKLYSFLHLPFHAVLWIIVVFLPICVPIVILSHFRNLSTVPLFLFLFGIIALEVCGTILHLILKVVFLLPEAIFNFLVDPVPTDGRSKEEAKLVVTGGNRTLTIFKFAKTASEWTDDEIEELSKLTVWHRFFSERISLRLAKLRSYYTLNPMQPQNQAISEAYIKSIGLSPSLSEIVLTNPIWRNLALRYIIFTSAWILLA